MTNSGEIPRLRQTVTTTSGNSRLITCTSISRSTNAPAKASFVMPTAYFDDSREALRDSYVQVRFTGGGDYQFGGYIDVDSADASPSGESVTLSATSATGWLHKVWVGQVEEVPNKDYRFKDALDQPTGLTPAMVLQDLFENLPPRWSNRIQLGDITELEKVVSIHLPPTISLKLNTYKQAMDSLLAYFGDLCWAERFRNGKCVIDFYRVGGTTRGTYFLTCANYGPVGGANIETISHKQAATEITNRYIVYGARPQLIIAATTDVDPEYPMKALVPLWNPALEPLVLQNPNRADSKSPDYIAGAEYVFRRYRLPKVITTIPGIKISKDLGVYRTVDGEKQPYTVQVWKYPTILTADPEDDSKATGTVSPTRQTIKNVQLDLDKFTFTITSLEDALNIIGFDIDEKGVPVKTYQKAKIGINFAVEPVKPIKGDTGASASSGVDIDLMEDGFTESVQREDFKYIQYTNYGFPFKYGEVSDIYFDAVIFDESQTGDPEDPEAPPSGGVWFEVTEPLVVRDDTKVCQQLADQLLRSRNIRARELNASIPFCDASAELGMRVKVNGIDVAPDRYLISQITYDLVANGTSISADNALPPTRFEIAVNNGYNPAEDDSPE